jgi:hypothetical protein
VDLKQTLEDPVQKNITLSDIAPKWARRFEQEKNLPLPLSFKWIKWYFELDIPSKCVVGEAHGFSSSYEASCSVCNRLGWQFGHSFLVRSRTGLENDIQSLVAHWNEKHLI